MARCAKCGDEHELLDPAFNRPDPFMELPQHQRDRHARASDDECTLRLPGAAERHFLRTVIPVRVSSHPEGIWWGVWVELAAHHLGRIRELWDDANQASEPPIPGRLANRIPGYPDTLGLRVAVQLVGPTSRPEVRFPEDLDHPFAVECKAGVSAHRASEWMALVRPH